MKKVVAVILNYNSCEDTEKCVRYVKEQNYDNLDIVIVDNASTDENEINALMRISESQNVKLIINSQNKGFSAGNNIGLKYAGSIDGEWAMIINPDVELRDKDYIRKVFEQVEKWSEAVVVGTNIVLPNGDAQNPMNEKTLSEEILWLMPKIRKTLGMKPKRVIDNSKTRYCNQLTGCCFFVNMEFMRKINYLDENVFLYCEERILASQVSDLGYKELFLSEVTANHEHYVEKKQDRDIAAKMRMMINSRIYWIKQYSDYKTLGKLSAIVAKKAEWLMWRIIWWK